MSDMRVMQTDIAYIKEKVEHLADKLDKKYVTRLEFEPVKIVVYGLIATVLVGFVTALWTLIQY